MQLPARVRPQKVGAERSVDGGGSSRPSVPEGAGVGRGVETARQSPLHNHLRPRGASTHWEGGARGGAKRGGQVGGGDRVQLRSPPPRGEAGLRGVGGGGRRGGGAWVMGG